MSINKSKDLPNMSNADQMGDIAEQDSNGATGASDGQPTRYINLQFAGQPDEGEPEAGSTILMADEHGQRSQYVVVSGPADSKSGIRMREVRRFC
jgi:hypothetical protein